MYAYQFLGLQYVAEKNGWTKFISMQNYYNLAYREEEREMLPACKELGVGYLPRLRKLIVALFHGHLLREEFLRNHLVDHHWEVRQMDSSKCCFRMRWESQRRPSLIPLNLLLRSEVCRWLKLPLLGCWVKMVLPLKRDSNDFQLFLHRSWDWTRRIGLRIWLQPSTWNWRKRRRSNLRNLMSRGRLLDTLSSFIYLTKVNTGDWS